MTTDYPNDENGDVLRQMAENGIDLTLPRTVSFEHCFPDQISAINFLEAIRESLTDARLYEPEADQMEREVQCQTRMVPTHHAITETEGRLADLAKQYGGYADGWGSLSNEDGTPANG